MSSTVFEQERLSIVKNKIISVAASLPQPEVIGISLESLFPDNSIRNVSSIRAKAIFEEMSNGTWKSDSCGPLIVNRSDGRYLVFKGNKRLAAMKMFRAANINDPTFELVKCHLYTDLDFSQKLLIANPSKQGAATIIQKLKLLIQTMHEHSITVPKGKEIEKCFADIMNNLFRNDYPSVLNEFLELPPSYLEQLIEVQCGTTFLEEMRVEASFWKTFIVSSKKNPAAALNILSQLETKSPKEVEKLLKKVDLDLLLYLSERGPHDFKTEADAIVFFTNDPKCSKTELIKMFNAAKANKNKSRQLGRYNWNTIKSQIQDKLKEDYLYPNAKYLENINGEVIGEQDFILVQSPIKPQLEMLQKYAKKAVVMLIGNYGDEAPEFPELAPTAVIKVLMENPLFIDKVLSSLPDPVVNMSIYLPGAPTTNKEEKTKYLCSIAAQKCSLASTMTWDNTHEIASLLGSKNKAAVCFPSTKIATHFLSKTSFTEISVIGDSSLRSIVYSKICPEKKKRNEENSTTAAEAVAE